MTDTQIEATPNPERQIGDVWKKGNKWLTKMPNGILASKTKKRAQLFADSLKPGFTLGY